MPASASSCVIFPKLQPCRHVHAWSQQRHALDGEHSSTRLLGSDAFLARAGGNQASNDHVKLSWHTTSKTEANGRRTSQARSRGVSITLRRRVETADLRRWTAGGTAETTCTMCAARVHGASLARSTPHSKPSSQGECVAAVICDSRLCHCAFTHAGWGLGPIIMIL